MEIGISKKKPKMSPESGDIIVFSDGTIVMVCYINKKYCIVNFEYGEMQADFESYEDMQEYLQNEEYEVYSHDMYALEIVPK